MDSDMVSIDRVFSSFLFVCFYNDTLLLSLSEKENFQNKISKVGQFQMITKSKQYNGKQAMDREQVPST